MHGDTTAHTHKIRRCTRNAILIVDESMPIINDVSEFASWEITILDQSESWGMATNPPSAAFCLKS